MRIKDVQGVSKVICANWIKAIRKTRGKLRITHEDCVEGFVFKKNTNQSSTELTIVS